jgi:predicted Zn-dependent protease
MTRTITCLWVAGLVLSCSTSWGQDLEKMLKKAAEEHVQQKVDPTGEHQVAGLFTGASGVSQEDEVAIGRQIAGNLLGAAPLVKDPKLQKYVNDVGAWVAAQSERPDLPWHFGVIESKDINAFAAPGGYIFLTRGLYRLLSNEAQLAGVLAHEIGHVIQKHHLKLLQQGRMLELGSKLAAKEVGDNRSVQKVIGNGAEVVARSLDKNAEFEADRIAVVLGARAGYEAFAFPEVLQLIGHSAKDDGQVALLFKTHPLPDDRLDKLGSAMGDRFDRIKGLTLAKRFYRIKP